MIQSGIRQWHSSATVFVIMPCLSFLIFVYGNCALHEGEFGPKIGEAVRDAS
jgi:hypothetical protein